MRDKLTHFLFFVRIYMVANGGVRGRNMKDYIRKRVLDIGNHILESKHTVRQAATVFGVSKSTVHKDMIERLPTVNKRLANKVKHILEHNKAERHIRGGEATRKKYKETKEIPE
jgi:putative DeoR family transcriptional regulator (stage III sporulation protein D)